MRLESLDLAAFGPFRHTRLDFGQNPGALQVVFGRNEAGKSTTLRAITHLLYGIPERTPDAYRHDKQKLRIGATLLDAQGERVRVVRRKGRVNTLLDPEGEPLDETLLARLLGGTPRELYERMFGLDHESLRAGAEALLAGGGDVGESLFDAGIGGVPVHRVLRELGEEAEALFKPRGSTPQLNVALRRARELGEQRRAAALAPEKWQAQRKALEDAERRHQELSVRRHALSTERARLARALAVLPKLRELERQQAARQALGDVPRLDADAASRRIEAEKALAASEAESRRAHEDAQHLQRRLQALGEPPREPLGDQVIEQLREGFGNYRKAAAERPGLEAERRELVARIEGLRTALPAAVLERVGDDYRPPAGLEARLSTMAAELQRAVDECEERNQEAARREDAIAVLRDQLETLGEVADVAPLEALLADPRVQIDVGGLAERRTELEAEVARVERGVRELGLDVDLEALCALALPASATLASLREREQALDQRRTRLHDRQREVDAELVSVRELRAALAAQGEVPSEGALALARAARDEAFETLRAAYQQGKAPSEQAEENFRGHLAHADQLADRLRREADRVQRASELEGRSERALEQGQALLAEIEAHAQTQAVLDAELDTLLSGTGLAPPLAAHEIERRLEAARVLQREAERVLQQGASLALREADGDAMTHALAAALGETGEPLARQELGRLLAAARQRVRHAHDLATRRQARLEALQEAQRAHQRACARRDEGERGLSEARAAWTAEAEQLGLGEGARTDELLSCVRMLRELAERRDDLTALDARLQGMTEDMQTQAREVQALCERHLPAGPALDVAEAMDRLSRHHQDERERAIQRKHFGQDLDKLAELARHAEARGAECRQTLRALCERAGVQEPNELPAAEQRAAEALHLDERLSQLSRELSEVGEGEPLEALRELVAGVVPERARARLAELEDELGGLREELEDAKRAAGRYEADLERLEDSGGAADLAEQQESQLAQVLELGHQYLVRRVAERILRGEVERYREANQGPLLRRASELVAPLTLGRYTRLKQDFEDETRPRLYMVRADGQAVDVAAMSDGTRDALYLALRLSSLERFVRHNTPLPLVLDDCFIHLDDERARAALTVLGEYTKLTQVLLFTHHARIVELARQALGASGIACHDLDEARQLGEDRNDGPLFASR